MYFLYWAMVTDLPSPSTSLYGESWPGGLPRRRMRSGTWINLEDSKEKDPVLSGSSPSKHTKSVTQPGREGCG